jgi:hypothetical protein
MPDRAIRRMSTCLKSLNIPAGGPQPYDAVAPWDLCATRAPARGAIRVPTAPAARSEAARILLKILAPVPRDDRGGRR